MLAATAWLSALALVLAPTSADAQPFPSGVIRIVVPTSASTPPDILARIIANALSDGEDWKVIVENKPGGVNRTNIQLTGEIVGATREAKLLSPLSVMARPTMALTTNMMALVMKGTAKSINSIREIASV